MQEPTTPNHPEPCAAPSQSEKWFALVNDTIIAAPRRHLPASVLRAQAAIPADQHLFRDHNSPDDVLIEDDVAMDLGHGNVFYSKCANGSKSRQCAAPPKLAFAVDDRPATTIQSRQTGRSLRELFGIRADALLLRDLVSPNDKPIADDDAVLFGDGPVFLTKCRPQYCINIEGTVYPWLEPTISTAQIRTIGNLPLDQPVVCEDTEGRERTLREDEVLTLEPGCRFGRAPKYKRGQ